MSVEKGFPKYSKTVGPFFVCTLHTVEKYINFL